MLFFLGYHEVFGWVDKHIVEYIGGGAGDMVDFTDSFDCIAIKFKADDVLSISGDEIDGVAFYAESTGGEFEVVAFILSGNEFYK